MKYQSYKPIYISYKRAWERGFFKSKDPKFGPGWHWTPLYHYYVKIRCKVKRLNKAMFK